MANDSNRRYELRTLGVGGILDQAIRIVRDNFSKLLSIFLPLLLFNIATGLAAVAVAPVIDPQAPAEEQVAALQRSLPARITVEVCAAIGGIVLGSWINAALIHFVSQSYLGNSITAGAAMARGWSRFGGVLWTTILYTLTVMVGFLLLIIPGIYFTFWYLFCQQVTVVENMSGSEAMKRSRALMKGSMNTAFLLLLVLGILAFAIGSGANLLGNPYLTAVVQGPLQAVFTVVSLTALVVFYFSCRCKKENFDLERLAETLDGGAAPAEAV